MSDPGGAPVCVVFLGSITPMLSGPQTWGDVGSIVAQMRDVNGKFINQMTRLRLLLLLLLFVSGCLLACLLASTFRCIDGTKQHVSLKGPTPATAHTFMTLIVAHLYLKSHVCN